MNIKIKMSAKVPTEHGQYYAMHIEHKIPTLGRVFQDTWDYEPQWFSDGLRRNLNGMKGQYYFSVEPVTFSFVKSQGVLERELAQI